MTTTKGDCGCHDGAAAADSTVPPGTAARTVFVPRDAAAEAKHATRTREASGSTEATGTRVLGGFRGLNPQDGLFLRGEHLAAIQDYSRALNAALATASGTGIVHGLGVAIVGKKLVVSPGLAISPRGRLLLLNEVAGIPLDATHLPALDVDGFWRVELHWAWDTSGSAPAYGSLCADECRDGNSTIRTWRDEGVEIRIVPDSLERFGGVRSDLRANWLSSQYFERERRNGRSWLTPVARNTPVPPLGSQAWSNDTPAPDEQGVPLALVYGSERATGDELSYRLQLWTARRLLDGPVAHATWQGRLAMRPWSVFLAQILQFETEVTGAVAPASGPQATVIPHLGDTYQLLVDARDLFVGAQRFIDDVKPSDRGVRSRPEFAGFVEAYSRAAAGSFAKADPAPVSELFGIGELPPAGYLPMNERGDDIERRLSAFFGPNVLVRTRMMRADQVADEVLAAQHRDRIPLHPVGALPQPKVDVLLPVESADKPELSTDSYGWVAFVRHGPESEQVPVETPMTEVGVYIIADPDFVAEPDRFTPDRLKKIEDSLEEPVGLLRYPEGEWTYPRDGNRVAKDTLDKLDGKRAVGLIALAQTVDDEPLASTRAGLFGMSLDSGFDLPVLAFGRGRDAIIVVAQQD